MIICDLLVKSLTCVYARTKKGLFQFTGDNIAEHIKARCQNQEEFPPEDQILRALTDIHGTSEDTHAHCINLHPSLPSYHAYICGQPKQDIAEQVREAFRSPTCRHVWIGCWTPNGHVGVMQIRSPDEISGFELFRHRLALAIDEEAHYAAARAWLSGHILCDGGIPLQAAKRIEHRLARLSSRILFLVFNRETGQPIRVPVLSGKARQLRPYVAMGSMVYEIHHTRPSPDVHWVFAHYAIPNARTDRVTHGCWAVGRDPDRNLATIKAIAEATERYGSGTYQTTNLITGRWEDLHDQAVDPRSLIRFDASQYQQTQTIRPFNTRSDYCWTMGTRADNNHVLILADLVYYPFRHGDTPYAYANSCGVAAHTSREEAQCHALLELIERDAIMRIWRHRLLLPTISNRTIPAASQRIVNQLTKDGFTLRIHWATFTPTPTVFVSVTSTNPHRWPNFTCAAASNQLTSRAVTKAIYEADAALRTFGPRPKKRLQHEEVRHVSDHGLFSADPANRNAYGVFFSQPTQEITMPSDGHSIQLERLRQMAMFVDLTPQPITGPASLFVTRAFIPGLIPMTFGAGLEPLGMNRMRHPPSGLQQDQEALDRYRLFPHPFA